MRHCVTLYTNRKHESLTSSPGTYNSMSEKSEGTSEGTVSVKRRKRLNGISNDEIGNVQHEEISKRKRTRGVILGKEPYCEKPETQTTKKSVESNKTAGSLLQEGACFVNLQR
ncbi:hypothetical protein HOLleu_41716 [Holothuria leucospilota]|uniref:Uncharacterized protein n=1 Tax=Holothuria leucospilota TaxID=206669 RepID=A0A9Q0YBX4_HOLLE|nr:hypothetical protein HOLleu_41716 [Holothuria leucospilota]